MTTTLDPAPTPAENPANTEIVLIARSGTERIDLTAMQVLDTVASYLATGGHMPDQPGDPYQPLQVIREQWMWGNVEGWVLGADFLTLDTYRTKALAWIHGYFGHSYPAVTW